MWRVGLLNAYEKLYNNKKNNNSELYKPNVLVVGNGWSGHSFSKSLDKNKYNLTIIDKNYYFLETHKMSSNFNPIKNVFISNSKFIQDEVKEIDTKNNQVVLQNTKLKYDYLVFALGSEVNTFNIPSANKYCMFYKNVEDLIMINELKKNYINIIGGGAVGIELAYKLYKQGNVINIIEAFDILPGYSENTKNKIKKDLENKKKIHLFNNCKVTAIIPNEVLSIHHPNRLYAIKAIRNNLEDMYFPYETAIWTAGIKCHRLKPEQKDNVFIIGDNSRNGPPTAQKAKQEGEWLAKYFNNSLDDKYKNFEFKGKGKIIHTDDGMFIEFSSNCTLWLPECFNWIIYKIIDLL